MNNLTELVEVISRQRTLMQRLLYRVVSLRTLMVGGHARFIGWASDDVDAAARQVSDADLRRAALWAAVATQYGLADEFSFDELLTVTAEPLTSMVTGLRQELAVLATDLRHNLAVIDEQATEGQASAAEVLARLRGVDPTVTAHSPAPGGGVHIDARL